MVYVKMSLPTRSWSVPAEAPRLASSEAPSARRPHAVAP